MNTRAESLQAWRTAHQRITKLQSPVTIPKALPFPHPRDAGALPTVTWPVGQLTDYALTLNSGDAPLLIREFNDRYEAFLDGAQLTAQAAQLAERNPTASMYIGGALLGAAIGIGIGKNRGGALIGASVGLLAAVLIDISLRKRATQPAAAPSSTNVLTQTAYGICK